MAPKNRRWLQLKAARNALEDKRHKPPSADAFEIYHVSDDDEPNETVIAAATDSFLQWKTGAGSHLRAVYTKSSRTTLWRKKKAKNAQMLKLSHVPKITTFFAPSRSLEQRPLEQAPSEGSDANHSDSESVQSQSDVEKCAMSIEEGLRRLSVLTCVTHNQEHEARLRQISKFDFVRYLAIENYLITFKRTGQKLSSSIQTASTHFRKRNPESYGRRIRYWAEYYLSHQKLPSHRQGCHVKTPSLIHEEDVMRACRQWLRTQRPDSVCAASFTNWIKAELHKKLNLTNAIQVSERTSVRWLHELGMSYSDYKPGAYCDGHEREDVVQYRNLFLERMQVYEKRMPNYVGDNMETVILPDLSATERNLILVTHDESCFSSYDGRTTIWMDQDRKVLRPKGDGRSIMVSAFLCECHGLLQLPPELAKEHPNVPSEAFVIIQPGKNNDGYWKNSDLVNQVESRVIPIFKILHPQSDALLMFDNSQNHHALPPNALNAKILPKKDNGTNIKPQRPGWFINGEIQTQEMVNHLGQPKGLVSILKERGLWDHTLSVDGARKLLSQQPDFQQQKEWLAEVVGKHDGFLIDFYPKFHCEFNFIEMYWAACKTFTRRNCTYSFKDLQSVVPVALQNVDLARIRRFAVKCYRYMDAYRLKDDKGSSLTARQIEFAVKKYKSHRRFPMRCVNFD
jgi:hypothetical protein